jgi:hypothetical protein
MPLVTGASSKINNDASFKKAQHFSSGSMLDYSENTHTYSGNMLVGAWLSG